MRRDEEKERLSVEHCKKVLNRNGNNFTGEQIIEIRNLLYVLAQTDYNSYQHLKKKTGKNGQKCNLIH